MMSVKKIVTNATLVRRAITVNTMQSKAIARNTKAKLEWKPTVSRPLVGFDGSVAYALHAPYQG